MKKTFLQQIISLVAGLTLLVNSPGISAIPFIFAQEEEVNIQNINSSSTDPIPQNDPPQATSSASPQTTSTPNESTSNDLSTPKTSQTTQSLWKDNGDGSFETVNNVSRNEEYTAPQNSKVKVKFNLLPDPAGKLTIKEVKLTPEQMSQIKALSDTAYDLSSQMINGTFKYTLILPAPVTENVEVKASEDGKNFVTLGGVTAQTDTLIITGLNHFTLFVLVPAGTGGSIPDGQDTSVADTYLKQDAPNHNFGGEATAEIKSGSTNNINRTLVKFNLSPIPEGSTISSANLKLFMTVSPASSQTLEVYKASSDWSEGSGIWQVTNAAWNRRTTSVNWTNPGGDFTGSPVTTTTGTTANTWLSWDVTTLVQNWYTDPASNFGFLVKNNNEGVYSQVKVATRENTTPENRPRLEINFTAPVNNHSPSITLNSPNGGEFLAGGSTGNITWTASDADTSDTLTVNLEYTTDGNTYNSIANGLSNTGSYSWTIPNIDFSIVKVRATVSDGTASTIDLSDNNFTIDSTAPTGSISTPTNNAYYKTPPSFTAQASDSSGITSVQFQYKAASDANFLNLNTDTTSPYSADWSGISLVNNTSYNLKIIISDNTGHSSNIEGVSFNYDNEAPTIVYNYPSAGGTTGWYLSNPGNIINIDFLSGGGSLLNFAQRKISNGSWTNIFTTNQAGYLNNWGINWTSLSEGQNQISLRVVDQAGNERIDNFVAGVSGFLFRKHASPPTTVYIDDDYSESSSGGHEFGYDAFSTIQSGIDAVSSGGTVDVAAGTYDEAISIDKSLTLQGAGNSTVIKKTGGTAITVSTGTVAISQIKLSGSQTGLLVNGGDVSITDSEITLSHTDFNPQNLFNSEIFMLPSGADLNNTTSVTINQRLILNVALGDGTSSVDLPPGVVISKVGGGTLNSSLLSANNISSNNLSGFGSGETVSGALQWGIPNIGLEFSAPITLNIFVGTSLNGQTLNIKRSTSATDGWTSDGIVSPATCVVSAGICTFQASKASYYAATQTISSDSDNSNSSGSTSDSSSSGSTASSNSNSSQPGPPVCDDTKPAGAPVLLSAVAGNTNEIILTWFQAPSPVSYYLVAYGVEPSAILYGNPNIGDQNTTSYTVKGLSSGKTYYFKVRAGNGCAPGDYSNELSVRTYGQQTTEIAQGFAAGVLGEKNNSDTIQKESEKEEVLGSENPIENQTLLADVNNPIIEEFKNKMIPGIFLGIIGFVLISRFINKRSRSRLRKPLT